MYRLAMSMSINPSVAHRLRTDRAHLIKASPAERGTGRSTGARRHVSTVNAALFPARRRHYSGCEPALRHLHLALVSCFGVVEHRHSLIDLLAKWLHAGGAVRSQFTVPSFATFCLTVEKLTLQKIVKFHDITGAITLTCTSYLWFYGYNYIMLYMRFPTRESVWENINTHTDILGMLPPKSIRVFKSALHCNIPLPKVR